MFYTREQSECISRQLRIVQMKYEHKFVPTFDVCIADMAKDSADSIDSLLSTLKDVQQEIERMKVIVRSTNGAECCEAQTITINKLSKENLQQADKIDSLLEEIDHMKAYEMFTHRVSKLPNCNTCADNKCRYKVAWGENVRYNCPLYAAPSGRGVI